MANKTSITIIIVCKYSLIKASFPPKKYPKRPIPKRSKIENTNKTNNKNAIFAIKRAMEAEPLLQVTLPNIVDESILDGLKID